MPVHAASDEEVVRTMVPQRLRDELVEDGGDPEQVRFAFVRWPSTNGTPQILAVYVTDLTSELSLIRLSDPPFQEDSLKFPVGGHTPRLTLRDLDNDSKLEALWELPLDRTLLVNVLTVEDGKVLFLNAFGDLADVLWYDLDGDGIPEGISRGSSPGLTSDGQPDPVWVSPVFGFVDGTLFEKKEIFAFETFYSSDNSADPPEVSTVFLGRLDVQYRLRIVPNGVDDLPQGRSADIVWNGVTVMTAAAFARKTPPFTVNVVPKRENTLELRNITPDHSAISVVVEEAAPIVPLKVKPFVDCVWDEGGGRFTASFGYENENPHETRIDFGTSNRFSPEPIDRGQSKSFLPGRHMNVFWVQSNGEPLTWTLNAEKVATATLAYPTRCQGSPPAQRSSMKTPELPPSSNEQAVGSKVAAEPVEEALFEAQLDIGGGYAVFTKDWNPGGEADAPAPKQAPSDEEIVRSMIPQSLKSELLEQRRDPADIKYSYVRWPTTGGTPQILAAYNSDQSMEVVLIQLSDPPAVIDTSDFPYGGYGTKMTLRDIDNDGALEAVWEVDTIQGSETNLLTVQDGKIYYLNAPGDLMESTWVDFDGDGVLEAISRGHSMGDLADGSEDPVWISPVYRFRDGTLVHEGDVFNFSSFSVGRQPPREQVKTVFLGRLDVPYRIRVLVNDPNDTLPQSRAADIVWNGVNVMTAEAFVQKTPPFTVNVVPKRENTLELRNITPDHSAISVVVEAAAPIVPLKVSPVVECVWDEGGSRFTASFGYNNPNPSETRIVVGPTNKFTPAPIDRGQRKAFLPGRHRHEFWVQSNGEKLVWTLNGKTATASLSHPTRCQGSPPAQR